MQSQIDNRDGVSVATYFPGNRDRHVLAFIPRPLRFLAVGAVGLTVDLSVFTAIPMHTAHPILTRVVSLAAATLVTWRLNRAFTFRYSGRRQTDEAMRYATVTALAQGTSFTVFTALVLTVFGWFPQAALVCGAASGAVIAYTGHLLFAFRPVKRATPGGGA